MVVNMYIISPKKDQFKPVFFGLFDFSKMKRPRSKLQKTNKQSFSVLVLFGLSPVQLQSFASPRTGLSNTTLTCRSGKFCNSLSISPSALASLWQLQCSVPSIISCCISLLTCLYTILCIFSFSIDDEYLYNCRWCSHFATPVKW